MSSEQESNIVSKLKNEVEAEAKRTSEKIQQKTVEKEQEKVNPFDNIQSSTNNIFANKQKRNTFNLFENTKPSVNLFQNNQNILKKDDVNVTAKSIFNALPQPSLLKNRQTENSQSLSQCNSLTTGSNMKTSPKVKIMKYEYQSDCEIIKNFPLKKFKNGSNPSKEEIYVTIEKIEKQINTLFLIVRNNVTKIPVFKGIIMKSVSKMDNFMGKKDNLRIEVLMKNVLEAEEGERKEKFVKDIVKMQFMSDEDCKECEELIINYFGE